MKRILITNADGNLGAGISKLLVENFSKRELYLVALVNEPVCIAADLCHQVVSYPTECCIDGSYEIEPLIALCNAHSIDAIIPLTDHETVVLSEHRERLPYLFCSDHKLSLDCYDKWDFHQLLREMDADCPQTWLPSDCPPLNIDYLVKPRTGGLSMGIKTGSPDLSGFGDDHIVQEMLGGKEVTVAIYRNPDGTVWGPFVGSRKLFNGMTCYFKPLEPNSGLKQFVDVFSQQSGWHGPCNIQGMLDGERFVPFEINLRFSGSSSLRDLLGFRDVIWAVEKWLGHEPEANWQVDNQTAIRYFSDHLMA